jgi:2-polyprenyl-3-methyl-5-hydroxy-6-metoxy-1,4-benzoquinol methylase
MAVDTKFESCYNIDIEYTNMDYISSQQSWIKHLNLSDRDLDEMRNQLPHPKYLDFVSNSLGYMPDGNSKNFMIESYNNIKDESWPVCNDLKDLHKLPKHIIDECRDIHGFDFLIYQEGEDIDAERWSKFSSGDYPVSELVRYKHVILDLQKYLKDKKIIDFACHAGMISLLALHAGAEFVTATNVRPEFVKLAEKMLTLSGHKNFSTEIADLHDYQNNQRLCKDVDVVLLYGIMYHVHDHCQILESIIKSMPKTIIIDTWIDNNIIDNDAPMMSWDIESSSGVWNGWFNGVENVFVGAPNVKWFELFMNTQDYKLVYDKKYFSSRVRDSGSPKFKRAVMVFERN